MTMNLIVFLFSDESLNLVAVRRCVRTVWLVGEGESVKTRRWIQWRRVDGSESMEASR